MVMLGLDYRLSQISFTFLFISSAFVFCEYLLVNEVAGLGKLVHSKLILVYLTL